MESLGSSYHDAIALAVPLLNGILILPHNGNREPLRGKPRTTANLPASSSSSSRSSLSCRIWRPPASPSSPTLVAAITSEVYTLELPLDNDWAHSNPTAIQYHVIHDDDGDAIGLVLLVAIIDREEIHKKNENLDMSWLCWHLNVDHIGKRGHENSLSSSFWQRLPNLPSSWPISKRNPFENGLICFS
jgi:hypothetical protein